MARTHDPERLPRDVGPVRHRHPTPTGRVGSRSSASPVVCRTPWRSPRCSPLGSHGWAATRRSPRMRRCLPLRDHSSGGDLGRVRKCRFQLFLAQPVGCATGRFLRLRGGFEEIAGGDDAVANFDQVAAAERKETLAALVDRSPAGDVVGGAGGEGALLAREPADERGDLLGRAHAAHRDPLDHVVDVRL